MEYTEYIEIIDEKKVLLRQVSISSYSETWIYLYIWIKQLTHVYLLN